MSYILDALKKSEEERRKLQEQQNAPFTSIIGKEPPLRKRRIVPALILSTFMLLAMIIMATGWWFLNRVEIEKESLTLESAVEQTQPKPPPQQVVDKQEPQSEPDSQNSETGGLPEQSVADETAAEPKETALEGPPEASPLLSELPFSTRSMLPDMIFRGHVYSPIPDKRMIMINSTVVREGDLIAPELTLLEITETGLTMKYRQTTFQVKLL